MKSDDVHADLDRCANCTCALEIVAVKFSFLYQPEMLFACPNCGLMRAGSLKRIGVRGRIAVIAGKNRSPLSSQCA